MQQLRSCWSSAPRHAIVDQNRIHILKKEKIDEYAQAHKEQVSKHNCDRNCRNGRWSTIPCACSQLGMPVPAVPTVTDAAMWFAALPCEEEDDHSRYHSHTNELLIVTAQEQLMSAQSTWCFANSGVCCNMQQDCYCNAGELPGTHLNVLPPITKGLDLITNK